MLSVADFESLLTHLSSAHTHDTPTHLCLKLHVWYESRFQSLTLLDLAYADPASTYLEQTEIHRSAHKLFKLMANQRVSGGAGKVMRELTQLVLNGNAKINIVGALVEQVNGIRMPLMKVKKQKFNKQFIEWEVLKGMLEEERLRA